MSRVFILSVSGLALMLLSSCDGEDGGPPASGNSSQLPGPSPTPASSPSPTPSAAGATDKIIYEAKPGITLAHDWRYWGDLGFSIRYDGQTGFYYVSGLYNTTERVLQRSPNYVPLAGNPWTIFATSDDCNFQIRTSGDFQDEKYNYRYTNLAGFYCHDLRAQVAFGIPTTNGAGPRGAKVVYRGLFETVSDEKIDWGEGPFSDSTSGEVELTFDPATNNASLTLFPKITYNGKNIASAQPIMLNWSVGQAEFHEPDPASATSLNYPISGRFAGPDAQELIGGLKYKYISDNDGKTYEMRGAFVAKR